MSFSMDDGLRCTLPGRQLLLCSALLFLQMALSVARADSWQLRSPVPGARAAHSAVWTGREMIVWGGGVDGNFLNTGARYTPSTDTWQTTSPYDAPSPRWFHAAVWTGSEMIIWGGRANFFPHDHASDGARYNPTTDSWTPMSTEGAPTPRSQFAAVWTGAELIVWGGETEGGVELNDGARYNPETDTWTPISDASGLEPRMEPTGIWTGEEMIVFGGMKFTDGQLSLGNGARYNPVSDTWRPLPSDGAPRSRTGHTAVWTGERMIVWGGRDMPAYEVLNDGSIYSPGSDTWTPLPFSYDVPQPRFYQAAVWTGSEMIIWGGHQENGTMLNTGARYNPASGVWTPTTQHNAPGKRMFWRPDLGIWTGGGMLVCGGSDYPASLDSTYLYRVFDPPCPPVIREQPQNTTVVVGNPVTLSVGASDCATAERPSSTQTSEGPYPHHFEFEVGASVGQLRFDYDFFSIPDSLRVYYEGQLIFDSDLSGEGTIRVPFGPGSARSVTIVVNEDGGPASTAWEYTVSFRPSPLRYQWRKDGTELAGETNATLHFSSVRLVDAGDYSVVVSNTRGTVVSDMATLTVLPGPQSTNCVVAPAGLGAWWRFDGNLKDAISQADLTIVGEPSFVAGKVNQALRFDGINDGVKASASAALNVGTNEGFSIELWVNPQNVTLQPLVVWSPRAGVGAAHFYLGGYGAGSIYANVVDVNGGQHSWRSDTGLVVVNQWQHVAMSYDKSSGLLRFYLNGQKVTEYALGSFTPLTESDAEIGFQAQSGEHFTGLMDELSIYGRVLTDSEMSSIYNAGAAGKCGTNAPPPCAPPGLVAWWRGDGDARDVTGAYDGELLFGTTFSQGVAGQAFTFDLSRARVSIPDHDAFKLTDSLSFEGWINVASHAPGLIFIRGDNRGGLDPYHMSIQPSGQLHWSITTADNNFVGLYSPGVMPLGVWTHVAAVLDGATGDMGMYINGVLVNQTNTTLRPLRDLDPNSEPTVGIGNHGGTFHHFPYHGSVDDWALYSRVLSGAEIQGIFNAGAASKCATNSPPSSTNCVAVPNGLVAWWRGDSDATDASGAHDGELLFGTTFSPGVAGQAFTFDLSRARVSIPDHEAFKLTDSLSFEGWINVASHAPGLIFIRGDNRGGLDPYHMSIQPSGQLHWSINTADNNFVGLYSPGMMPLGVWTHVAAVLDGVTGNMGMYVNGVLVNQTNTTLRPLGDLDPNWEPAIGIGNAGGTFHHFPYHGSVDEWALYSRALSAAEIQGIFNAGAAGKCGTNAPPPPVVIHDMSQDFSPSSNPAGVWSYGYSATLGGPFNLLTFTKNFAAGNGVPLSAWQVSDSLAPGIGRVMGNLTAISEGGAFTAPPGTVWVGPGNPGAPGEFGLIRFTVPAGGSGVYRIESAARSTFDGPVSGDSDFHVLKNGQELFGQFVAPNSATGWSNALTLAVGDTIDFAVGRGADGSLDHSSLKVHAVIALVTNVPPPTNRVFDLSGDFSLAANPNGPWSYGHLSGSINGSFELLNTSRTFGADNGVPIDVWQLNNAKPWVAKVIGPGTAVSTHFVGPPGTVYFGPDPDVEPPDYAAIRFTVPPGAAGTYRLATMMHSLYDSNRSAGADFHVLKNGQELFGRVVPPNSGTAYSNVLALVVGDRIDFVAGRGTNGLPDTGLKIQATLRPIAQAAIGVDVISILPSGGFRVTGHAPPGTSCRVERSVNLVDWEPAGSAVEGVGGAFEFIDSQPPTGPACFYRFVGSNE